MISFNTITRKAAEDLGLPGPEAAAPAEDQKSEKKPSKEEAEEVNISFSVKKLRCQKDRKFT